MVLQSYLDKLYVRDIEFSCIQVPGSEGDSCKESNTYRLYGQVLEFVSAEYLSGNGYSGWP